MVLNLEELCLQKIQINNFSLKHMHQKLAEFFIPQLPQMMFV